MLLRKRCRGTLQDYNKGEISECQSKLWTNRNRLTEITLTVMLLKRNIRVAASADGEFRTAFNATNNVNTAVLQRRSKKLRSDI